MANHWKKNNKLNKKQMNEFREDITAEKEMFEVVNAEDKIEPAVIQLCEYNPKFLRIQAYRMPESSTVHCADGKKLLGEAGDFYVQLDKVQEFILPADIFKKMFLMKIDK